MSVIKAVLFDLDGTLIDSFPGHYSAYEEMFAHFDIEITKDIFLSSYSPNWYMTYKAFGLAEKHWDKANSIWLDAASRHQADLFPGVREVLGELSPTYSLGIVTSGSKSRVTSDIDRLGITSLFNTIITGDDITDPKPAPEGLELALRDLSVSSDEAVYVGDAFADFEMARAAGVKFLGVESEFANLDTGHHDYEVASLRQLPVRLI
jgi:phosphoglycolate phosphatase/pyrophosphatase PpaX